MDSNTELLVQLATRGLFICLYVSLPVVAVAALSGLLVSFLQAITSLQDQTLSHGVKLAAVILTIAIMAPWGASMIYRFTDELFLTAVPR